MNIELHRGQALVLLGPSGSGKTRTARLIAKRYGGRWIEGAPKYLQGKHPRLPPLTNGIIIEGMPTLTEHIEALKMLLTLTSPPFVIICDYDTLTMDWADARRFRVLRAPFQENP